MFGKNSFLTNAPDAFQDRDGGGSGGGGGSTYSEVWKKFSGDGSTTDFDCGIDIDRMLAVVDGITMSTDDYVKDGTEVKFNNAPADGAEIRIWILDED